MTAPKNRGSSQKRRQKEKTGFIRYKDEQDGLYYFRYDDATGNTLFTASNGYATAKSRNRGISNTKNALPNYEVIQEGNQYLFVIKSPGNNVQMAHSRPFSDRTSLKYVVDQVFKELKGPQQKEDKKVKAANPPEKRGNLKDNAPPRYAFRLTFYPAEEDQEMNGSIEYILGENKKNFKGLDMEEIYDFLNEILPVPARDEPSSKGVKPALTALPTVASPKKEKASAKVREGVVQPEVRSLKMNFFEKGTPVAVNFLPHYAPIEIKLSLDNENLFSERTNDFEAFVIAKSFHTGTKTMLGKKEGTCSKGEEIKFPISVDLLNPGPYRILSSLKWHPAGEMESEVYNLSGDAFVLVK